MDDRPHIMLMGLQTPVQYDNHDQQQQVFQVVFSHPMEHEGH